MVSASSDSRSFPKMESDPANRSWHLVILGYRIVRHEAARHRDDGLHDTLRGRLYESILLQVYRIDSWRPPRSLVLNQIHRTVRWPYWSSIHPVDTKRYASFPVSRDG
jgi:hypothetical protein